MLGETGRLPRSKVKYINYIHSIGCNIVGLKSITYTFQEGSYDNPAVFWRDLASDLRELVSCDADYNQLGLIQLRNSALEFHMGPMRENLPVVFTQKVRGGHGNSPLTLFGIDLEAMSTPGERHNPVPEAFLNLDGEDDD